MSMMRSFPPVGARPRHAAPGLRHAMALLALCCAACSGAPTGDKSAELSGRIAASESATAPKEAPRQTDEAWLAERGAKILADVFRSVRLEVVQERGRLSVADRRIEVNAHVDAKARQGDQHIMAVDFRMSIDGTLVPALRAGAIGIDPTSEGARETAVSEWGAQYGAPLGYAIARWLGAVTAPQTRDGVSAYFLQVRVDGETFYHGLPGTRGRPTDPGALSSPEFVQKLAARAVPLMGARNRFRSATIQIVLTGGTVTDGECRVNGDVSPALLAELHKINWPKDDATFMYKMFFAVAPNNE